MKNIPLIVQVPIEITSENIQNLLTSAFEGGANYWVRSVNLDRSDNPPKPGLVWWGTDEVFEGDFEATITFDDPDGDEGNGEGSAKLTWESIHRGLRVMARKEPHHFADVIRNDTDAVTGDVFMQCALLGGVVYG